MKAKSLFATKTFQGASLALMIGLSPIIISCAYDQRWPMKEEMIAISGLIGTFGWALVGRTQTSPVYTENFLPGPNKCDFEQ